jgi:hypothetical protein
MLFSDRANEIELAHVRIIELFLIVPDSLAPTARAAVLNVNSELGGLLTMASSGRERTLRSEFLATVAQELSTLLILDVKCLAAEQAICTLGCFLNWLFFLTLGPFAH